MAEPQEETNTTAAKKESWSFLGAVCAVASAIFGVWAYYSPEPTTKAASAALSLTFAVASGYAWMQSASSSADATTEETGSRAGQDARTEVRDASRDRDTGTDD